MPQRAPILEVRAVSIFRGGTPLLRGVNWRIERGQRWAIIGPNGSGKTSLLSALAGFLHASEGTISVLGNTHGTSNWQELRQQIGIVSSSVRQMVDDGETALEVVASGIFGQINFWGELRKAHAAAARSMLRQVGCVELEKRPWAVLSQGERQRALIGRALLARPKLLILDEPCAGLDPAAREHFLDFVNRLVQSSRGPAILLVTHHVEEIMPAFTHVLALRQGAVFAAGPKQEVLRSGVLSRVFDARMRVTANGSRYALKVLPLSSGAM